MKTLVLSILAFSLTGVGYSQNYYTPGTQVSAEGITFNVINGGGKYALALENAENTMGEVNQLYYKDGRPLEPENYGLVSASPAPGMLAKALTSTFTKSEFEQLRKLDDSLVLSFYITPEGKIIEVAFIMGKESMQSISPEKFAILEKNLRKYLTFDVNALGRKLQYMYGGSFVNFPIVELHYPGDPQPGIQDPQLDIDPLPDGKPGWADPMDGNTRRN